MPVQARHATSLLLTPAPKGSTFRQKGGRQKEAGKWRAKPEQVVSELYAKSGGAYVVSTSMG